MGTAAYIRVSTNDQTVEHQRLQVTSAGIAPDRWFTDTASGRDGADRPGFRDACNWLREGDTLVVVGVDRLGRSVREVAATLHELAQSPAAVAHEEVGDDRASAVVNPRGYGADRDRVPDAGGALEHRRTVGVVVEAVHRGEEHRLTSGHIVDRIFDHLEVRPKIPLPASKLRVAAVTEERRASQLHSADPGIKET